MAIQADKNAKGELNGRWRVEVQLKGQRLRDRCDTYEAAQKKEKQFRDQLEGRLPMPANAPATPDKRTKGSVKDLAGAISAAQGKLWKDQPCETENFRKLNNLLRVIGNKPLNDIGLADMDKLVTDFEEKGRSGASVNRAFSAINKFLKWAISRDYRTKPMFKMEWHKESEGRIRWIEPHEEARLYELLPADIGKLVRCAIVTGMRRGELLPLTPDLVEWHEADGCGWVRLWKVKNGTPRSVPIDHETYEDLCYLSAGNMPSEGDLRHAWNKARKTMRLAADPWFVFHACRHTCATRLVQANVNLAVVKEYMGHKTIETTLRYAHVNATSLTEALRTLKAHTQEKLRLVA